MSTLPISKEQEAEAVARIWNMGIQSLHPDAYGELEMSLQEMCVNRHISYECVAKHQIILSGKAEHSSDCPTSVAPAMLPGPCDCDCPK
jgi:hypothetical protein